MDDSRWHILKVKSGCEDAVAAACGAPAYVPRQRVKTFHRRFRKVVSHIRMMLPGFVFIKLRAPSDLALFMPSKVYGFLRNVDRSPVILSEKSFKELRLMEFAARRSSEEAAPPELVQRVVRAGEIVSMQVAMFADAIAVIVEEIKGNRVFGRMLQSGTRVQTTLDKVA